MQPQDLIRIPFGLVNAYLVRGAGGDLLIDTGLPGLCGRLLRVMRTHGSGPERLTAIVLTHVHLDHVGNLGRLRRLTQAPLLVHRLEAEVLASGRVLLPAGHTPLARMVMGMGRPFAKLVHFAPIRPDIIADDERSLRDFGVAGQLIHTPGHTAGSMSVVLDSGAAVVGDLCQNGWGFGMGAGRIVPPLADLPDAIRPSWRRLVDRGVRRWFPGHGTPFDVQAVKNLLG